MNPWKFALWSILLVWLAGVLQNDVAPRLAIGPFLPDFFLIAIACLACTNSRSAGALVGFGGGIVQGAIAGANLAAYAISRTVAGFLVGWFGSQVERSIPVSAVSTACATVVAQLILMFGAPPSSIGGFLLATMGSAVYNGVVAIPVSALLNRVLGAPSISGSRSR